MRHPLICMGLWMGLITSAWATVTLPPSTKPASVSSAIRSTLAPDETFQAKVVLAPHSDWMKVWAVNAHPIIPRVSQVSPGDQVDVLLFFSGATLDAQRNVDVTARIQFFRPDGTQEGKDQAVTYKQTLGSGTVFMIPYVATFSTEAKDPKGPWVVHVIFTDNQGHQTQALSAPFMAN